jgi:YVTN family beta-propeller protein
MSFSKHLVLCAATLLLSPVVFVRAQATSPLLLVLDKNDNALETIEVTTGKVVGKVPTGDGPHEVVATPDGKVAFASNYGASGPGNSISMIDLVAQKEIRRIDTTPIRRPHGLGVADGKLYFTAELNRLIARYDPATDKIDWLLGTGQTTTHMLYLANNASRIFTANIGGNSIAIFDRSANGQNWSETVVPVGQGPEGFDVSPDGTMVWAAHSVAADGGVSVIDVASRKVVATIDAKTKRSNRLKFTPDGKHVLISDYDAGDILVLDVATRTVMRRIPVGGGPLGVLMPPSGGRAYVALNNASTVAAIDLTSFEVVRKIPTGGGPDGMAWVEKR